LYVLTVLTFRRESLAFGVVALTLTQPLMAAGSSIMTIDAPYTACWGWALVFGYLAAVRNKFWAWPVTGLLIAIGILAKYTMVLFVPSLAIFLLLNCGLRIADCGFFRSTNPQSTIRNPQWKGFAIMCLIGALGAVPIFIWNAQHDWVTFRHVGWQAGARAGWRWLGPLSFLGGQFGILLGFWFVVVAAALWSSRPWKDADPDRQFLWWLSVPTLAVFMLASFKTTGQLNWAVTAYLSGGVLAAGWLGERIHIRGWRIGTIATAALGSFLIVVAHYPAVSQPVLLSIVGTPTKKHPLPLRRFDPTARLRGYRTLAAAVDRMRQEVRAGGEEPIIACTFWNLPGLLGIYCDGRPTVYTLGPAVYDRRSQLDFWRPNPLWDADEFRGRSFVLVGDLAPQVLAAFDRIDPPRLIQHCEAGQPIAMWYAAIGWGYRGFGPVEQWSQNKKY
jgi:hypothetical protein